MSVPCIVIPLGMIDYMEAWDLQKRLAEEVKAGHDGWLLILEHPHSYTFGRAGNAENLSLTPQQLEERGAKVYWVDRGGDITYHGPGQLVGYPIVDLHNWSEGTRWFVRALENALIEAIGTFGVKAEVSEGRPGVWVGNEKLAAIGLHISQGVTTHGFALNVAPDLSYFDHIVSCGLEDAGVSSIARVAGRAVSVSEAADAVVAALSRHLDLEVRAGSVEEMMAALPAS
ncbi:MAG TPA: lipoyl(octanoyl) transferase LipB [Dehalococcoidia bacterium]|nr:lipoyl(octanoyl) transferase LipB [Dehalococcoidia bacterium]